MDRRKRKTKEAVFRAFTKLLSKKSYEHITVAEIIEEADVGRTTFYTHFETKDALLEKLSEELICHVSDLAKKDTSHRHIFKCDSECDVFLHLFRHVASNDNQIGRLICTQSNPIFLHYFKKGIVSMISGMSIDCPPDLPRDYLYNHAASVFIETLRYWAQTDMTIPAETVYGYFKKASLLY